MSFIQRDALLSLQLWRKHPTRKPLLVRGARQVGKSYLVREFGREFDSYVEINFERDKQIGRLFQGSLAPKQLISSLAAYVGQSIVPGRTLLFLDEIQECEEAILALRYFKEEMPELHLIAAGSLLDFKLNAIGLPVGRLQFLYLYPLSFSEYCRAVGKDMLLDQVNTSQNTPAPLHDLLLEEVKRYCWLGGMPAVLDAWITHQDYELCQETQKEIIQSYRQDFNRYAKSHQLLFVEQVFSSVGLQLGQKFKYSTVHPEVRAANLREALLLLETAGVIYRIFHTSAQGLPLASGMDDKRFKVYFFDIGLLQCLLGVSMKHWLLSSLTVKHMGGIAEQFVQQEYIAYTAQREAHTLFYWHREAKQSNAEIDFIFIKDNDIVPVEVKSGATGRMRSLQLFLETHPHSTYALKISESPKADCGQIRSLPFYAIQSWFNHSA